MEIDPAALSRTDSNTASTSTTNIASKPPPAPNKTSGKPAQQSAPRFDLESLYTTLKSDIGEHWGTYKDALSRFVLGYYNQEELCRRIESFIFADPNREHLHNQLVCGIYANVLRDAPEAGVASWVSANDKPTSVAKPPTGDLAEQRLKAEVMRLPPRMRNRLKTIQDEPQQPRLHSLLSTPYPRSLQQQAAGSAAVDSSAGLNKDLDVRRRYTQPLVSEMHDLPAASALAERVLPICYEEGLSSGVSNAETCAELLSTALETFVKETITSILAKTRCNAPVSAPKPDAVPASATADERHEQAQAMKEGQIRYSSDGPVLGILTHKYKSTLAKEEAAYAKGEVKRSEAGLLPCEIEAAERKGGGKNAAGDLRLAWELGDVWLTSITPWLGEKIVLDGDYGYDSAESSAAEDRRESRRLEQLNGQLKPNGIVPATNGVDLLHDDPMEIDGPDWKWQGARAADHTALNAILDDCLNFG